MFANLLSNAIKYSPPGATVNIRTRGEADSAVIAVRDYGAGMTPGILARVFEMFYQADDTLHRSQSGLGVGLTLARTIAELHGGSVEASSEGSERGSEFVVRLPLSAVELAVTPQQAIDDVAEEASRIVLVEDHQDNREMFQLLLEFEGHRVETAADGVEGLALIEQLKPDVAFVDIGLPLLDGYCVAERVRANPTLNSVILIALSGYVQPADVERARHAGFDRHLPKPVTPGQLLKALHELQHRRRNASGGRD